MLSAMRPSVRQRLGQFVESQPVQNFIIALIVLNAITLGLETSSTAQQYIGGLLFWAERAILTVFVIEIGLKLIAFGPRFFRSGWNVFDFVIVAIALAPETGPFSILRALRILRVLRLLSQVERLRVIIESLLRALPSIGWIAFLLVLVFYIFGVMGTKLFGESFPEWFGTVGLTMYSLFQVMTLESWSMGIARPVMEVYPHAWLFFVPFILITAFTVLNLFIGIIVNTMQELHWEEEDAKRTEIEGRAHAERERMVRLLEELHEKVDVLEKKGREGR
ncbi:ion transporter [Methylonatrum kenyense]|uniref:ion transporter n=1 Tax=Methylonatrum kenyense TaxID=455253 RepID=UPI0020C107DD|nr:ion transporter [Methylonatrum kenyense]MCK8517312.1 ion transporter [Methylonatrum kenyense]